MNARGGIVYLVGGGPGDPGLITVRGLGVLRQADVIIHDRLSPTELLAHARQSAEIIDAGKGPGNHQEKQARIQEWLVDRAASGQLVVRLKGGDPFVFGRGFEELASCRKAGVPCVVIPGVTSAVAGPAAAGIPVSLRDVARTFAVVTASTACTANVPDLDFAALARMDTVVVLMGLNHLPTICRSLADAGMPADTPAACIERATTPQQRVATGTLATIADIVKSESLTSPSVTVFGSVVSAAEEVAASTESSRVGGTGGAPCLHGRRVVSTRPAPRFAALSKALHRAGAIPISCPLTRIEYPTCADHLDHAIEQLPVYDWIAFTSAHGVRGFFRRLRSRRLDARAIAFGRVAAVGSGTARALRKHGVIADVVADGGAASLAAAMLATAPRPPGRILFPSSNRARAAFVDAMSKAGSNVDAVEAYRTVDADPPPPAIEARRAGVDAILFYSPSAVQRFCQLKLDPGRAVIACIGETTAGKARQCGLEPEVRADVPTNAAMLDALARHFAGAEVTA